MELTFTPPAPTRAFSHEQVARCFFVRLLDDNDDNDESTGQWRCKICTRSYRQDDRRGCSNLITHLRARHPDFEERIRSASVSETGSLLSWVSQRAHTRFGWISSVVEKSLLLTILISLTKCKIYALALLMPP
ncbi:hypothetical protein PC110_g18541 [Phytophthora cactorum]|uniref:BED-type domain-containing protein n=1 Tax=Phytophthora cactorum TaxID=29920 RepID=A0A329RK42_9STRA|nr:hypothetical protein PC111_g18277 [Phytophthora cactorum]KAG2887497.1 hypothetical protein PC114_g18817 [Phytophthora cactorum]KAG2914335.1 hypothetical protein PC117_g18350 [Phytophthora cactorum]KAG2994692.1 hypothetical protein PC119_g18223 [Phytophthora cactorum]KAG3198725.1 hypothetical protein PC128_g5813 [Phytophthora cactorum]